MEFNWQEETNELRELLKAKESKGFFGSFIDAIKYYDIYFSNNIKKNKIRDFSKIYKLSTDDKVWALIGSDTEDYKYKIIITEQGIGISHEQALKGRSIFLPWSDIESISFDYDEDKLSIQYSNEELEISLPLAIRPEIIDFMNKIAQNKGEKNIEFSKLSSEINDIWSAIDTERIGRSIDEGRPLVKSDKDKLVNLIERINSLPNVQYLEEGLLHIMA